MSQDAFLLWFLRWANPEYSEIDSSLHECSCLFVKKLLNLDNNFKIESVKVEKQVRHIDVFCIVNDKYAIIIEDKTETTEHGRQMTRYSKIIESSDKYKHLEKHCTYFKTGNESLLSIDRIMSNYKKVNTDTWNFSVMQRQDMIDILEHYKGTNAIILDYRERIVRIENSSLSYLHTPLTKWGWKAWQGLYKEMESIMDKTGEFWWGSVASKSGSFVCAAWHRLKFMDGRTLKLQIEGYPTPRESRLCIKLELPKEYEGNRVQLLRAYGNEIISMAKERNLELQKPKRYNGRGRVLTIADVDMKYIVPETFSIEQLLNNLKAYQNLLDDFVVKHK